MGELLLGWIFEFQRHLEARRGIKGYIWGMSLYHLPIHKPSLHTHCVAGTAPGTGTDLLRHGSCLQDACHLVWRDQESSSRDDAKC